MLYREITADCKNHTKYIYTFCEKNEENFNVKPGGIYINHQGLKS